MELKKKKYKKNEVEVLINGISAEYELKFIEQRDKIRGLVRENNDLKTKLEVYTDRESLILSTLMRAESTIEEVKKKAELQYELELKRIKNFSEKWNGYFKELKEKYPLYPVAQNAVETIEKLDKIVENGVGAREAIDTLDGMIEDEKSKFNPKKKIEEYIAATSNNGFNMEEVLNPGALKLEDICRELGLIEENE